MGLQKYRLLDPIVTEAHLNLDFFVKSVDSVISVHAMTNGSHVHHPLSQSSTSRHVAMDFVQEGANLTRAQGTPYEKQKTPRIWPTIFGSGSIIFYFLILL